MKNGVTHWSKRHLAARHRPVRRQSSRAAVADGGFAIGSAAGRGTTGRAEVPFNGKAAA
jgi:hypothetical protein